MVKTVNALLQDSRPVMELVKIHLDNVMIFGMPKAMNVYHAKNHVWSVHTSIYVSPVLTITVQQDPMVNALAMDILKKSTVSVNAQKASSQSVTKERS